VGAVVTGSDGVDLIAADRGARGGLPTDAP
jgi:hypothetical protein